MTRDARYSWRELSDIKTPLDKLLLVTTSNKVVAYISGDRHGIFVIDNLGNLMRSIQTVGRPSGLALMANGSLIYAVYQSKTLYHVSPNYSKRSTKLIDTGFEPRHICCFKSGYILVRLASSVTPNVVRYDRSSGNKVRLPKEHI